MFKIICKDFEKTLSKSKSSCGFICACLSCVDKDYEEILFLSKNYAKEYWEIIRPNLNFYLDVKIEKCL